MAFIVDDFFHLQIKNTMLDSVILKTNVLVMVNVINHYKNRVSYLGIVFFDSCGSVFIEISFCSISLVKKSTNQFAQVFVRAYAFISDLRVRHINSSSLIVDGFDVNYE